MPCQSAGTVRQMPNPGLPQVLAEIEALVGTQAMWTMAASHGGRTIYIPAEIKPGHHLAQLLGLEAAQKLAAYYRDSTADLSFIGRRLLIPMATGIQKQAAWREALDGGLSVSQIATQMGVHERTAKRHRRRARLLSQPSLF